MADLTFLYKELTPIQVGQFTEFSASLNNVLSADKMQEAQQLNVVNYCADLLGALRSGLPWTHLTEGERDLLCRNCHESHWKKFAEEHDN